MTFYALENIDDAISATRSLLWPFDPGQWAKLAVVVLFIGGAGGVNPLQFGGSTPTDVPTTPGSPDLSELVSFGAPEFTIIVAIAAVLALIGVLFTVIGSIMEFVFVESLRQETVTIRRYWGEHWRRGLRLFGFRLLLGLLTVGLIGLPLVAVFAPVLRGNGGFSVLLLVFVIPFAIAVAFASGLVYGFTNMFVVPVMLVEHRGVLSAWRRFWPTMTDQWTEYAVYAVLSVVLRIAGGIAASIITAVAALAVVIPFGIVGALGAGLLAVSELAGWAVIGVAALLFVLALVAIVLLVAVPVQAFLRYYALLVLGDTNETFDLIPEQRRSIRE